MATILVVEDDMELLGLFQTVLENENYNVISATNGLQALDIVSNQTTPGNGLGLSLVHKIIALHKGSITMYSQKDEGTEITIRLPKQGEKENEKTN